MTHHLESLEQRRLLSSFLVNTTADPATWDVNDNVMSLREAIAAANASPGSDLIAFDLGAGAQTIALTAELPQLTGAISIVGPGATLLRVRGAGGGTEGIFANSGTAVISGLTIANGDTRAGGGIFNTGSLTVTDCVFSQNRAWEFGGAIFSRGALLVQRSVFSGNRGFSGGGIKTDFNSNTIVEESTFSGNNASAGGAGISSNGPIIVRGCTFANNSASSATAVYVFGNFAATIENCTITGNVAGVTGSAIGVGVGNVSVNHCTISGNNAFHAGAVVAYLPNAIVTLSNTIVTDNINGDIFIEQGTVHTSNHNLIGVDAKLAALADNGGPTMTMALLAGSPAINTGDPAFVPPPLFDQRGAGFARVSGGRVDIGAFEVQNTPPTSSGIPDLIVAEDAPPKHLNLREFFDDAEDGPAGLIYTIVANTNAALFASASIDSASDVLTLAFAADAHGVAHITIRATDSGGLFVDETFTVTVLSVQQQLQNLRQQVAALPGLNHGNRNSLLVKLNLKGNNGDFGKVQSFIESVQTFLKDGRISQRDGRVLIVAAEDLLMSLA